MKSYPALDVRTRSPELLLAQVDDFSPSALEERGDVVRIFFQSDDDRRRAERALAATHRVEPIDVSDDDWARRSQENLQPVVVGRITIVARPSAATNQPPTTSNQPPATSNQPPAAITITIVPSMGFGTGHHATTRLCLAALQEIDPAGRFVVDVGTGSGILALAAARLGATRALGIDSDPDAVQAALDNLALNADAQRVSFAQLDLTSATLPVADLAIANLTGALLIRSARRLVRAVAPGGVLILSGILAHECPAVARAFGGMSVVWQREEDGWLAMAMKKP